MTDYLKSVITGIAPTLAAMLGGPLAGTAMLAIEQAFGVGTVPGAEQAVAQFKETGGMTPETLAAVRAADQKHAEVLAQQGIDVQKLNVEHDACLAKTLAEDRSSARVLQASTKSVMPAVLGSAIVVGTLLAAWWILTGRVAMEDTTAATMVGTVVGYLFGEAKAVLSFYFGDTQASARTTELLAQSSPPGTTK